MSVSTSSSLKLALDGSIIVSTPPLCALNSLIIASRVKSTLVEAYAIESGRGLMTINPRSMAILISRSVRITRLHPPSRQNRQTPILAIGHALFPGGVRRAVVDWLGRCPPDTQP